MELPTRTVLTLDLAKAVAEAAKSYATSRGWTIVLAIVDSGGHLVYLERMDGVAYGTVQVAILKAQSAAAFETPSKTFENAVDEGLIGLVGLPGMAPYEGAVPISVGGQTLGAIAISGVTKEIDGEIAQAAVDAVVDILRA
jgi:glc operon protein GlcG